MELFEQKPRAMIESLGIFVLFALMADTPPPGVNEAHYLTKARHYWDPSFCSGDLFLESADAHVVFYWVFGWVTLFCSLEASAWIGRILVWGLLATGWQRLSAALLPNRGIAVLTAAAFVLLQRNLHMAGEWVLGGVEAKCFAYGLVFHALAFIATQRWTTAWLLLGGATAFHVLVGGWSMVAAAVVALLDPERRPLREHFWGLAGGVGISLLGLLPAIQLSSLAPPETAAQAADIYVYKRLPHHLTFSRFKPDFRIRMFVAALAWGALWRLLPTSQRQRTPWARIQRFVLGALAICVVGIAIDLTMSPPLEAKPAPVAADAPLQTTKAASLLRYYWYRLSDVAIPLGIAFTLAGHLVHLQAPTLRKLFLAFTWAAVMWACGQNVRQHWSRPLPGAFFQLRKFVVKQFPDEPDRLENEFEQWKAMCLWMRDNTPTDARVLAPRGQQSLKWYAFRGEVSNWKDVPQDAGEVVRWYQRQRDLFPRGAKRKGLTYWSDDDLLKFLQLYEADYLLIDRDKAERTPGAETWRRIFPPAGQAGQESVFEVYEPLEKSNPDSNPDSDSRDNEPPLSNAAGHDPEDAS